MRRLYKQVINDQDASSLIDLGYRRISILENSSIPVIKKIIDIISEDFDFVVKKESYCLLEKTSTNGHDWHVDTGSQNHMAWCQVGASILIEPDVDNDITYYRDGEFVRSKYDMVAHTSDLEHMVKGSSNRIVYLIFI